MSILTRRRSLLSADYTPVIFYAGQSTRLNERWYAVTGGSSTITFNASGYKLYVNDNAGGGTGSADIGSSAKINLTDYKYIKASLTGASTTGDGSIYLYLLSTRTNSSGYGPLYEISYKSNTVIKSVKYSSSPLVLDVSNITGSYYIQLIACVGSGLSYLNSAKGTAQFTVTKIWLEK